VHRQQFRPGAEYDETLGAQGPLYVGDDGAFHTEPPVQTTVLGVDLRTGRTRWRSVLAGPAVAVSAPGEPAAALVVASDRLRLVDAATGAVLRERRLAGPAPRDLSEGDVGNGLVLVRHGAPVGGGTVTAYSARTLALLWRRPMLVDGGPAFCDTVLCEYEPRGVTVLDPATGLPRWRTDADVGLVPRAGDVIEVAHRVTRPLRVRDAVTGAVRADLGRWTYAAAGPPDVPLVVAQFAGARSAFGVLPAGGRAVQPLGYSSTPVTDCASDQRFLVCRVVDGAEVWAYLPVRNPGRRG
jgi:outer membrane protein assembly factor BamB